MNLSALFFDAFASRHRPSATEIIRPTVSLHEAEKLRELLAENTSMELTDYELRTVVEGNLWMLTPKAFLYFLPAFLRASLESYASVSVFASGLISALTEPSRTDILEALDKVAQVPSGLGLPTDMTELLRKQQLEWFDSGAPEAIFHERFDNLTQSEGVAILAFLDAFEEAHGADFPFDELKTAVDRYWARFRAV
ncbi:MAG TPA: hypothetical protein PKD12_02180 [Nitrospira sp.]|nr:hypothetical protein [Nitrospira sp.]